MDEMFKQELYSSLQEMILNITKQYDKGERDLSALSIVLVVISLALFVFIAIKVFSLFLTAKEKHNQRELFSQTFEEIDVSSLRDIAFDCKTLGARIDKHTNREDNSKNVSRLVYNMCKVMGLNAKTSALYFCIAMVYDAGFLDIPSHVFYQDVKSSFEKRYIKSHILCYANYIDFIPDKYVSDFAIACMYHHENYDGTGIPEGFKGDEIPLIARLISVADSYVDMVFGHFYQTVLSREDAIKILRKTGHYDPSIVNILEKIV